MATANPTSVSCPVTSVYSHMRGNFSANWTKIADGGGRMYMGTRSNCTAASHKAKQPTPKSRGVSMSAMRSREPFSIDARSAIATILDHSIAHEDLLDLADQALEFGALPQLQRARPRQIDGDAPNDRARTRRDDDDFIG